MLLKLDMASKVPIYLQIRNQIVLGIASGELPPGEKLPTILMGDMNAGPDSAAIRLLRNNLHDYPDIHLQSIYDSLDPSGIFGTYHGFKGRKGKSPIDYIFFTEEFQVENA